MHFDVLVLLRQNLYRPNRILTLFRPVLNGGSAVEQLFQMYSFCESGTSLGPNYGCLSVAMHVPWAPNMLSLFPPLPLKVSTFIWSIK